MVRLKPSFPRLSYIIPSKVNNSTLLFFFKTNEESQTMSQPRIELDTSTLQVGIGKRHHSNRIAGGLTKNKNTHQWFTIRKTNRSICISIKSVMISSKMNLFKDKTKVNQNWRKAKVLLNTLLHVYAHQIVLKQQNCKLHVWLRNKNATMHVMLFYRASEGRCKKKQFVPINDPRAM